MTTLKNNTFTIALESVYHDRNLVSYQMMPEVFEWMGMYNHIIRPGNIEVDERLAPFMMISFDYGTDLTITDIPGMGLMRIIPTTHFEEIISYN